MSFEITAYMAAQSASAIVSLFAALAAWRRRNAPGGLLFALMMAAVSVWTVSVSLEAGVTDLASKILFSKISYLGLVNAAPLFLLFSVIYQRGDWRIPRIAALLWVVPAATLVLTATNELHGLIWASVGWLSPSAGNLAVYAHGPLWWIFSGYNMVLILAATAYVVGAVVRAPPMYARQSAAMVAAAAVVWAGFFVYVSPGNPIPGFDLPAGSFAVAGSLILWGLTRGRILSLSPVARDRLLEATLDGLLVEDARGRLVDANPRALTLLRRSSSILGTPLETALAAWPELAAVVIRSGESGSGIILPRDDRSFELTVQVLQSRKGDRLGRMVSLRDVTRRRRAEEATRESERDLRALLQAAQRQAKEHALLDQVRTSLAFELDLPEVFRTVVEGIARVFGYTLVSLYVFADGHLTLRHQVGYSSIVSRIPPDRGITGRVFRTGVPVLVENVRDDPDFIGAIEGVVSEVCIPLFDQGVPAGVLNVESTGGVSMGPADLRLMTILGEHVSIALSKARLYAQARENEERYRTLVATLAEGIAIVDFSERFEFANPAAETVFGVPPGGLVGKSLAEFLDTAEYALATEETKKRREGLSTTYELVIHRPDGETRQIELVSTPRRAADGTASGTLGIFRDVTQLRQLQGKLEQERSLLLTLIDSLPDYVYLKDRDGRFILTNRAQALLVGAADSSELVGRTDADFVPRELAERYRAADLQVMRSRSPVVNIEEPSEAAGGSVRRVLTTKVPMFDAAGEVTGIVGISRDVTDLLHAEQEREKLQEQLQQSQKMEAVGRLAGGIAHDFNNILTVITGYSEMALEEAGDSRSLKDNLEEIKRAARRSATLISQLLAFSRRQILLPRVFDLAGLVEGMEGMLRRLLGEDVRLVTVRGGPSLMVNADPGRIEQVIMNLSVNSRDAMPGGGQLTIRTGGACLTVEELAGHPEVPPGEFVSLSVTDTGHGMDAATMQRLFEPFFTTKDVGKGTGLGLATVYGIVRQSSGHITCSSQVGTGTTFTVYLPRVLLQQKDPDRAEDARRLSVHGTELILLAEDDEPVRRYVSSTLESAGYTVVTAESGYSALEKLGSMTEPPELLLTDVIMPGMDGRVLAQEVVRRLPAIRVIFMSGYAEVVSGVQGLPDPDCLLIQKPFSSADLLRSVRTVLEMPRKGD
jgi:PAS domain S-box-containing protein